MSGGHGELGGSRHESVGGNVWEASTCEWAAGARRRVGGAADPVTKRRRAMLEPRRCGGARAERLADPVTNWWEGDHVTNELFA